jgi:hypothetical protein
MLCSLIEVHRREGGGRTFLRNVRELLQTIRRHISVRCILQGHQCENLVSEM